jgi:GTP cyclohydrolase IA
MVQKIFNRNILTMSETIFEEIGNNHYSSTVETPLRDDAFVKSDAEKIKNIERMFGDIMTELGLDLTDDSLKGTPYRVAKMYVKEMFYGLKPESKPNLSVFDNSYTYKKLLAEMDIRFNSACEHHFLPIVGKAHIGYVSSGKVIGLSKINRLVDYYARRPQVQERMTRQIFHDLSETLKTDDVIVVLEAEHLCVSSRGIKDPSSFTVTMEYGGIFENITKREEFLSLRKNS